MGLGGEEDKGEAEDASTIITSTFEGARTSGANRQSRVSSSLGGEAVGKTKKATYEFSTYYYYYCCRQKYSTPTTATVRGSSSDYESPIPLFPLVLLSDCTMRMYQKELHAKKSIKPIRDLVPSVPKHVGLGWGGS